MDKIKAFVYGIIECKSDITMHFDYPLIEIYDTGRAIGRILLGIGD